MLQQLAPAFRMTVLITVLTGLIYPGVVTGACQLLFKTKADGSLIQQNGRIVGSSLLGQNFTRAGYFHPRPSAAGDQGYDPLASQGSNLGPTSRKLYERIRASSAQFRKENPSYRGPIPADAVTASASGLDPHISIQNARAQAARVAEARGVGVPAVEALIARKTEGRALGIFGEPRVNVLELNLELDSKFAKHASGSGASAHTLN